MTSIPGFDNTKKFKVVIVGGGIHGVSIAYYLATKHGIPPLVIEQTGIASAASGKSGGFLARDWGNGPTTDLHVKSYNLHRELATLLNIESYREITTLEVDGSQKGKNIPSWLNRRVSSVIMDRGTAQVTSSEFTEKLLEAAKLHGTEVLIDTVVGVNIENSEVRSVRCKNSGEIITDNVVLALGPWAGVASQDWFNVPIPMQGIKSTSLVFRNVAETTKEPFAGFCGEDEYGCHLELYPRPNGDLYICGCGGSDYVEGDRLREGGDCYSADLIDANPARVQAALSSLRSMTSIGDSSPDITQACMRPCTSDALPVMGPIPNVKGAYISAGHNCWGILWAPISGLAMAELIATGHSAEINLSPFNPARFSIPKRDRGRKKAQYNVGEQW